jgi:hypothetical protein
MGRKKRGGGEEEEKKRRSGQRKSPRRSALRGLLEILCGISYESVKAPPSAHRKLRHHQRETVSTEE